MELNQLTAHVILGKLKAREVSLDAVYAALYARILKIEPQVKAYVRNNKEPVLPLESRPDSLLNWIPVTIKDNICTDGLNTECCSKIL